MITIKNPIATQPLRNLWQEAFQDTGEFLDNFFNGGQRIESKAVLSGEL